MNIPNAPIKTLFAGFGILAVLSGCGDPKPAGPQGPMAVKVTVEPVQYKQATYFEEYPATVHALNRVELRPQVSGFISGVHFQDGARVKKGQLLYTIDDQLYDANYQQAVANLEVQKANLSKAQKDADRYHELDKNDAIAKQLVDNADASLSVAKKQVAAADANIRAMQTNLKYTRVYAPFDGVVGISNVKNGTSVTAGQTILNIISSDKEQAVDINLDQKEIYRFSKIIAGKEKASDSLFSLAFDNDIYPHPGKLAMLDRAVNPQTGTIKARIIFPNPDNLLVDGMNGTVRILSNSEAKSILIPYMAVTEQLGEYFVYVPNDSNAVSQRKVELGQTIGADIVIRDGLKPEDKVVVQGVQNLREGAKIDASVPAPEKPATPAK